MNRYASLSVPFLGNVTALRWATNHGLGLEYDRETGTTLWLGQWEVNADNGTLPALPVLVPLAMLLSGAASR